MKSNFALIGMGHSPGFNSAVTKMRFLNPITTLIMGLTHISWLPI